MSSQRPPQRPGKNMPTAARTSPPAPKTPQPGGKTPPKDVRSILLAWAPWICVVLVGVVALVHHSSQKAIWERRYDSMNREIDAVKADVQKIHDQLEAARKEIERIRPVTR